MPFEDPSASTRRIAVVGGGISGMGAAHELARDHRVTLFEAETRLGGHARTIMAGPNRDEPVDTGFLVFNYANYPNLSRLFKELDVPVTKSNMSFGASIDGGRFEYGLASLGALFATRRNIVDPKFWRMMRDVLRFNARAVKVADEEGMTIRGLLDRLGTGDYFRERYLLPLSGAIWSTPTEKIMDFPAHAMMRFFQNHALLGIYGQHQWYTVKGGSIEYVRRMEQSMLRRRVDLRVGAPVAGIRRTPLGVEVRAVGGEWEVFDEIVMATHSDDSLRLLSDASPEEQAILGAVRYQPNSVVLHSDRAIMPRRRSVWSSWNYTEGQNKTSEAIDLTYWINSLQPWLTGENYFVTLNSTREIREEVIWDECTLRHPVYDVAALHAQQAAAAMNGARQTWFCGAWMKNGFHEDGIASALDAVEGIRARATRLAALAA